VLDFLGVRRVPLTSKLRKQRAGTQSDIVNNHALLKERFVGTRWASFFE